MTLVYKEIGKETYFLTTDEKERPAKFWVKFAKTHGFSFVYKGFHYYEGKKYQVVVFSNKLWSEKEIERRRNNGFKGIKRYVCE